MYSPNEAPVWGGNQGNHKYNHTNPTACNHMLAYCRKCDEAFCTKCGKEWRRSNQVPYFPSHSRWNYVYGEPWQVNKTMPVLCKHSS